jgi:hypothetical protein
MAHPRGESGSDAVRLDFDRRLMLQFGGSLVTSDAGLLAYRELDAVLGLTEMAGDVLADARSGKNGRHALAGLFRQSVFGRLAGRLSSMSMRTPPLLRRPKRSNLAAAKSEHTHAASIVSSLVSFSGDECNRRTHRRFIPKVARLSSRAAFCFGTSPIQAEKFRPDRKA